MRYLSKILAFLASLLLLTAFGLQRHANATNVAGYPHRHTDFDYKYAWKTVATDRGVVIDGVMKNVRYPYIDSLQVTVFAVDKDGTVITRATTFPMPQQTRENDVCRFSLLLRNLRPGPDDAFHFLVSYRGNEGGVVDWISSFKVDALTGAVIRPPARNPDEW